MSSAFRSDLHCHREEFANIVVEHWPELDAARPCASVCVATQLRIPPYPPALDAQTFEGTGSGLQDRLPGLRNSRQGEKLIKIMARECLARVL